MTESVIALFISQFEDLKTIGNSTHNFYKKCDTNKEQKTTTRLKFSGMFFGLLSSIHKRILGHFRTILG